MDHLERLQLQKMIDANQVKDCTDDIREKKHSGLIAQDVKTLLNLKQKYKRLAQTNPNQFDAMCVSQCQFIFNHYTDIFNKVKKDEMNLEILSQLLHILKQIEDGQVDQHTGSFMVGKLMKEIYIDSALMRSEKLDKKHEGKGASAPVRPKPKNISYAAYKAKQQEKEHDAPNQE